MNFLFKIVLGFLFLTASSLSIAAHDGNAEVNCNLHDNNHKEREEAERDVEQHILRIKGRESYGSGSAESIDGD